MQLFFEITEGDREGARFEIRPGLSIGRQKADIVLRDSKVSSKHAVIEQRENDSYFLIDAGSANGLKIGKEKVLEVLLVPGVSVRIGRTTLTVVDMDVTGARFDAPAVETWNETMGRLAFDAKDRFKGSRREVAAFNPLIQLKFLQGAQSGTTWTIGYGPRQIGFNSIDLRIDEPESPDICFELVSTPEGAQFQSEHPDKVRINGQTIRNTPLASGDVIEIGETKIEVVFKYDE